MFRRVRLFLLVPLALSLSCTSSVGLDLAARGLLNFFITRQSTASNVTATAFVTDGGAFGLPIIDLQANQTFSVNNIQLQKLFFGTHFATLGAVDHTGSYTVTFNNAGTVASMVVSPPVDFTASSPAAGTTVQRSTGFGATWSPSGDANVLVDLEIRGLKADGNDDGTEPDTKVETIRNLPDNGAATVGAANLAEFLNGAITFKITRFRPFPQTIGLSGGSVRVEIYVERGLTLAD